MALAPVVVGVADHTGWAALVCVSVRDGSPEVIDRRRVELIEPELPKHPYEHETAGMNAAEAERLVQEVRDSAAHSAERALSRLQSSLGTAREILSIALRTAPLPRFPGSVAEVHASWHVTVRADAMLYHDALCTSARSLGIRVDTFARGEERRCAAEATSTMAERLDRFLSSLRVSL